MTRDYRNILRPRPRWVWSIWLLAIGLLLASLWTASLAVRDAGQAQRWQTALNAARLRIKHKPPPAPSKADLDEKRRWEALAVERGFAWYPLFRALEQTSSPEIELLEFVPDKTNRRLTLRGEARSMEDLTAYLSALEGQSPLMEIYLAQQKNLSRGGMTLITFEIRASIR